MIAEILFTVALITGPHKHSAPPAWLDFMLAGYGLTYDEKHVDVAVYDPKSKYFLVRDAECDGGIITLTLSRDPITATENGFKLPPELGGADNEGSQPVKVKRLPVLATGKGIRIGDPINRVRTVLGKPTKTTGSPKSDLDMTYTWTTGSGDLDYEYDEVYTFESGTLVEISFSREANTA